MKEKLYKRFFKLRRCEDEKQFYYKEQYKNNKYNKISMLFFLRFTYKYVVRAQKCGSYFLLQAWFLFQIEIPWWKRY